MILKDVEIIPRNIPEHTYWFLRCLEYKYAKAFIERGSIRFARPSEWCKPDGTSRGDLLEGVYASQRGLDPNLDRLLRSLRKDSFSIKNNGFTFYKSSCVLSSRAHCLYGLNSNNMHLQDVRSQDHRYHQVGIISKDYFQNLFPTVKKEVINYSDPNRPAVLLITPDAFVHFVKTKLIERGVREEEIIVEPVSYANYYKKPFIIGKEPEELFSKHTSYAEQCEIRIVIDNRRKEVDNLFDENGVIELGPVDESIAILSEFYFDDMVVEIRNNKIYYSLAIPEVYPLDKIDDVSFIIVLQQALSDELPGAPMSIAKIENEMKKYLAILRMRDENVSYDKWSNIFTFKGKECDLGVDALKKMLNHYNNYIIEGDYKDAGDVIEKVRHFFPKYNMGDYFSEYYKNCGKV